MRNIEFEKVVETVESLCISACYELGEDVLAALEEATDKESNPVPNRLGVFVKRAILPSRPSRRQETRMATAAVSYRP